MNKKLKNSIKTFLFFSVGIAIFWWVYKDQDWHETKKALLNADYSWIILSLFLGLLSHISRAVRWVILIKPMGYNPSKLNSFFAVMIMYLSNLAIPRSGEVVRCGVMGKTENIPFTKLLGTVFIERIIDFIMLFILLAIVLITQMDVITDILNKPEVKENIHKILLSVPFLVIIGVMVITTLIFLFLFRSKIKKTTLYAKSKHIFIQFIDGVKAIIKMDKKLEFIAHSIIIWVLYFFMIYIVFWSFNFTEHLSLLTGLTVFVISSFGMVFPSPGGIGSWHIAVREALMIFGVGKIDSNIFAIAVHESMTLMIIIVGIASFILLPVVNKKNKP
jgi:uncharacterized protein (TIRG00374 family)